MILQCVDKDDVREARVETFLDSKGICVNEHKICVAKMNQFDKYVNQLKIN